MRKTRIGRKKINRVNSVKEYKFGRYNHWTIVSLAEEHKYYGMVWAVCDCGKKKIVSYDNVVRGLSKSCCYYGLMENWGVKHGCSRKGGQTPEYRSWQSMKNRCYDKTRVSYKYYGGRGITVCDRWINSFDSFLKDMGNRPNGTSLDRINVNGNYEPSNCRWATNKEQMCNTRSVVIYERNGISKTQKEWAKHFGVARTTIRDAVKKYGVEDMFNRMELIAKYKTVLGTNRLFVDKIYNYTNPNGYYFKRRLDETMRVI